MLRATRFGPSVEAGLGEEFVELLVEGVAGLGGQLVGRDEQGFLPRLAFAHRHRRLSRRK